MTTLENKQKRRDYLKAFHDHQAAGKKIFYLDEMNFNVWCSRSRGWSTSGTREVKRHVASRGKNMHVIACVSANGLMYWERRFGAFRWRDANDYLRRLLRSLKEQTSLDEVVLVLDNAPCHTHVEEVFDGSEFEGATLLRLGSYSPMLSPIENVLFDVHIGCEAFFGLHRDGILCIPPDTTLTEHRMEYMKLASDLLLPEIVTDELCKRCYRHTLQFHTRFLISRTCLLVTKDTLTVLCHANVYRF